MFQLLMFFRPSRLFVTCLLEACSESTISGSSGSLLC